MILSKTFEDRELEACTWIAKIDSGLATSEDISALREWILEHPENKQAFESFSADFIAVRDLLSTVGEAVHDIENTKKNSESFLGWIVDTVRDWKVWGAGGVVAASLAWAVFVGGGSGILLPSDGVEGAPVYYASNVGQRETVQLADGSSLMLNTNTEVSVEYTPYERRVHLVKGEAVFSVAKDPNRPFRVHTNRAVVKAIGTVFSVKSLEGKVELLVEEGIVEFTANAISEKFESVESLEPEKLSESLLVSSGGYTVFESATKKITEHTNVVELVERRMAWRSGMLRFESDPLIEVVEEYNRYIDYEIVIDDPSLEVLPVAGAFPIGEMDAFIDALGQGFGVQAVYGDDQTIRLTNR